MFVHQFFQLGPLFLGTAFNESVKQSRDLSWQTAVKEADRKHIPVDFLPPDLQNSSGSNQTGSAPPVGAKIRDYTHLGGK